MPKVDAPKAYAGPVEDLLAAGMSQGGALLVRLAREAVARLAADPQRALATRLFTDDELRQLAGEIAAVRLSGDLLGRSLLKDHAERVRRARGRVEESLREGPRVPTVLQGEDWSCGRAAMQAVLGCHGIRPDNLALGRALGTDPQLGTRPEALEALARDLGLQTEAREPANLDDLAHAIAHGAPCICCVQLNGGGHWVVVDGVEGGNVSVMCPVQGRLTEPAARFVARWWDHEPGGRSTRHYALAVGPPLRESLLRETKAARESLAPPASPLHALLEERGVPPLQPDAALDFFRRLVPTLGPVQLEDGRRTAFTLAAATDTELLQAVKDAIERFLADGEPIDTPRAIGKLLDDAGVSPANPQYAEQVMRTNVMGAYNQGLWDELARESETFPAWTYSNPSDGRSRPAHKARDGNLYPSSRTFASVRGTAAADVCNCRCTMIPVDKWELQERLARGERFAA